MQENTKDILNAAAKSTPSAIVQLVGTVFPGVGLAGALTLGGLEKLQAEKKARADDASARRLDSLVEDLESRVSDLEDAKPTDERVDLFVELVSRAIRDDEDRKQPFYSAALEWFIRADPPAYLIRTLANAIEMLSYAELYAFLEQETRNGLSRSLRDTVIGGEVYLSQRLGSAGLIQVQSVTTPGGGHIHPVGKVLMAGVDLNDLPSPLEELRRAQIAASTIGRKD